MTTALQALRGVQLLTAVTIAAEIGEFTRFATARQFMAYLGLVPTEHSSGGSRRLGAIAKTGNKRVRRVGPPAYAAGSQGWASPSSRESCRISTAVFRDSLNRNRTSPCHSPDRP